MLSSSPSVQTEEELELVNEVNSLLLFSLWSLCELMQHPVMSDPAQRKPVENSSLVTLVTLVPATGH